MTVLNLRAISKSYQDGEEERIILDKLDLQVSAGEFVAILGPSGSGKSTLLSIAGALLSADSGEIYLDGDKVGSQKEWTKLRREKIGFIFQNHQLLPFLTIAQQLDMIGKFSKRFSKTEVKQRQEALLAELGIADCAKKYPKQLSGGQKQRAAIARAFLNQPSLILADEPTASLDASRGRQVAELIRQEVKDRQTAVVMVTHDERILDVVDTVYRLENAKLVKVNN